MAEYLIIVVLIAVIVILAIRYFGGSVKNQIAGAGDAIDSAGTEQQANAGKRVSAVKGGRSLGVDAGHEEGSLAPAGESHVPAQAGTGAEEETEDDEDKDRFAQDVSRLRRDVGEDEGEVTVVGEIKVSWLTLIVTGAAVCAVGVALVFLGTRKRSGKGGKKKKKKKGLKGKG